MTKITIEITDNRGKVEQSICLVEDIGPECLCLANLFGHAMLALGYNINTVNELLNTDEFNTEEQNAAL
jgi:hypothetical protein